MSNIEYLLTKAGEGKGVVMQRDLFKITMHPSDTTEGKVRPVVPQIGAQELMSPTVGIPKTVTDGTVTLTLVTEQVTELPEMYLRTIVGRIQADEVYANAAGWPEYLASANPIDVYNHIKQSDARFISEPVTMEEFDVVVQSTQVEPVNTGDPLEQAQQVAQDVFNEAVNKDDAVQALGAVDPASLPYNRPWNAKGHALSILEWVDQQPDAVTIDDIIAGTELQKAQVSNNMSKLVSKGMLIQLPKQPKQPVEYQSVKILPLAQDDTELADLLESAYQNGGTSYIATLRGLITVHGW